jgi:hypothetical protein
MARYTWVDEGLYALLKSKADEWGYDSEQLLAAAVAYGLGDMILMRDGPRALREEELGRLEHYMAGLPHQHQPDPTTN